LFGSHLEGQADEAISFDFRNEAEMPADPDFIKGKLDNGLTYYIRENSKPENRAQAWLVVNAGSILEDDDQRGLAHFLEHMAFNGTENFAKHEIIDYLESIGMKFGPEINAYTGFDETVYMLQLPTDSIEMLEKGFQILYEWAHNISFEAEEIEKERGVIIEEWRLGRGASMRMFDKQLPILFKQSRYAERLPIGTKENLESFRHESLKNFYRDWYRPDLMAIVTVGDFDSEVMLNMIKKQFSSLPVTQHPRKRVTYPVPDHAETLFAMVTDPEATNTIISVYNKNDVLPEITVGDYRRMLIDQLFSRMMNIRFYELLNQAEPPFLHAQSTKSNMVRSKTIYSLDVAVKEDEILSGFEAMLTEATRVQRHGFTQTELDRTKTWMIRRMERIFQERSKTESGSFASEYLRNYLENEPIPGIAFEYSATLELLPGITLDEVNGLIDNWMSVKNRVILLNAPEKEELIIPSEATLLRYFRSVKGKDILAYEDAASSEPLMENLNSGSDIIAEDYIEELDLSIWELANGIKVMLKPTDFKNDEIQFQGISPGGNSLVDDTKYRSARAATEIISLSGVGQFDLNSLNKKLTGKMATVFPYINELTEGLVGNSSTGDIETLFQLIYLYMTQPRKDSAAYLSYKSRMQGVIENRFSDPESAFYDTLRVTLGNYHFRERPWSMSMLDEIDPDDSHEIYLDRFSDASDFTFVFVGSFDLDKIRPLIKTYLGSLPSSGRKEDWKDVGENVPRGVIQKTIHKGMEPKSRVSLTFTGDYDWNRQNNYSVSSMASVLRIKLRETLREDLSGTYGTSVGASTSIYPRQEYSLNISFGCAPDRVEELTTVVFEVIDSLKTYPVEDDYISKVSETQRRSFETSLMRNGFWLANLVNYTFRDLDPRMILDYPGLVDSLNSEIVQETARKYFDIENYVQVVLKPE
jgi:zinc protease